MNRWDNAQLSFKRQERYIYKAHYRRHPHGNKSHNVESWGFMSSCLVVCKLYACMSSFSSSWLPGAHNWKALQNRSLHESCVEHFCQNNWIIRYIYLFFILFSGGGNDRPVKYQPTLQQLWRWHKHLDHFSSISVVIRCFESDSSCTHGFPIKKPNVPLLIL